MEQGLQKRDFFTEVAERFKDKAVNIQEVAKKNKGLTIKDLDDKEGYEKVFAGIQELTKARTALTGFAKALRDEYTAKNRAIRDIEKNYLEIIEPVETELRAERSRIDEIKKRQERMILLPGRKKMLEDIETTMTDEELLAFDEKAFSVFYNDKKIAYLEEKERQRIVKEQAEIREKEIEEAKKKAVAEAKAKAKIDKERAIERLKKEQADKERKAQEEKTRAEERANEEQEKAEKNKKYQAWLKRNKYSEIDKEEFRIERNGNTFTLFIKISQITL